MSVRSFNRLCYCAALVWMLAFVAPSALRKERIPDFAQYYMGGAMVLSGNIDALYPIPSPGAVRNAGFVDTSEMRPAYAAKAREQGITGYNRFVYPPPVAILFAPLALLDYSRALTVWVILMCLAGWGVAMLAAHLHAQLFRNETRHSGLVALVLAGSPLMLHAIRSGNISPVVSLLLGTALLTLLASRPIKTGLSLAAGGFFKGTSAVLLPVVIARRQWSAIFTLSGIAVVTVGASIALMGLEPFRVFFSEIAPTHAHSEASSASQSLAALLLRASDRSQLPQSWSTGLGLLHLTGFAGLSVIVFIRRQIIASSLPHAMAAVAALLANSLAFSPLVWAHYHLYGFLTIGWLLFEARQSMSRRLLALIPIASLLIPLCLLVRIQVPLPEPLRTHMFVGSVVTIALAVWRLLAKPEDSSRTE